MLHESTLSGEYFSTLLEMDAEIARSVARARCSHCGGPLHQSNYQRKPRGGLLAVAGEAFAVRHSLCCGRVGCRKRALPPSVRFLGRRIYLGAVVLLGSVVAQLAATWRDAVTKTSVPRRTLGRWGRWWRVTLPTLPVWAELRARFAPPPPEVNALPRSLIERLTAFHTRALRQPNGEPTLGDVALSAAQCLAPATTTSVQDGARFVRGLGAF